MKKIKYLLVALLLLIPSSIEAKELDKFTIKADDNLVLEDDIDGSAIISGYDVKTDNYIDGVGLILGNNIKYNSSSDYLFMAANNININSDFKDGVIFGNVVNFEKNSSIERDLIVFASNVTLSGYYGRNVTIYAANVDVNEAIIEGNLKVVVDTINIDDSSIIKGTLSYRDDTTTNIDTDADVYEIKTYHEEIEKEPLVDIIFNKLLSLASYLVLFTILFYLVNKLFVRIEKQKDILKNLGVGLVGLFMIPFASIILLITVVGLPVGVISLLFYGIVIYTSIIFTGYIVGNLLWNKYIKKNNKKYLTGLMGISLIYLLEMLPIIGMLVTFISFIIGLGTIILLFKREKRN